jgi:hypothetical protein
MSGEPYARTRLLMFWFLAAVVGLVALGALALLGWTLRAVLPMTA